MTITTKGRRVGETLPTFGRVDARTPSKKSNALLEILVSVQSPINS